MLDPVGPLPASVYWRRRAVVFAGTLAVLLLLGWLLGGGSGGNRTAGTSGDGQPAASSGSTTSGSATASGSPTQPLSSATSGPATDQIGPAGDSSGGGTDAGTDGSGDTPAPATSASPPTPSAEPPQPCRDSALRVTVRTERAAYRVGEMPVIELTVQNVSATTCTRDLGAAQQEVLLYAGTTRIWSSNDCYPGGSRDIQALLPREHATFSVTWSGLSSRPHCEGTRTRVGAGRYRLLGRIGTARSTAATLTLR